MDAQTIYKKIEMPEGYSKGSSAGVLFGKEQQKLISKGQAYLSARASYLAALDRGAGTRGQVINILTMEKQTAEAYMAYARGLLNSGCPPHQKEGCTSAISACVARLKVIAEQLAGMVD